MSLAKKHIASLIFPARRGYDRGVARGQIVGIDFDTWRREEVERAVGKPGLRACSNSDYNRLLAHFESLAGEDGRALNALIREQSDSKRQAEVVLLRELAKAGLPPAYAEAISRNKFKGRTVSELDARQAWQIVFTIKNRLRAKARKRLADASVAAPRESAAPREAIQSPD